MSSELPHLSTPRLLLRPLEKHQAETLCTLANGPKIADEGCLRGAFLKNGVHEDMLVFAALREDWEFSL